MRHTPGPWKLEAGRAIKTKDGTFTIHKCNDWNPEKICELDRNARLIAEVPEMYYGLKLAKGIISIARNYFPKSIKNNDRFQLENVCATIDKAIDKVEGRE